MRIILSTVCLAFALSTASAEVLIYRVSERVKFTGLGGEAVAPYRGYWIIDPNSTNVAFIHWRTTRADKRYNTNWLSNPVLANVEGKNRSFSFLTESLSARHEPWSVSTFLKGRNQNLVIGTGVTGNYPRTFTGTAGQVGPSSQAGHIGFEVTYSFVYAQTMTVTNNDAGNDIQTILGGIRSQLQRDGYYTTDP